MSEEQDGMNEAMRYIGVVNPDGGASTGFFCFAYRANP